MGDKGSIFGIFKNEVRIYMDEILHLIYMLNLIDFVIDNYIYRISDIVNWKQVELRMSHAILKYTIVTINKKVK